VPLRQVAEVRLESTTPVFQHHNRKRSVTIGANVKTGFNTDRVTRKVIKRVGAHRLPSGYRVIPAGELQSRQESLGGLLASAIAPREPEPEKPIGGEPVLVG
jgi:multidrug efflux pump subunit AcrB